MKRTILTAVSCALYCAMLAGCGTIDRCPAGLYDPGSTEITRQSHQ